MFGKMVKRAGDHTYTPGEWGRGREAAAAEVHLRPRVYLKVDWPFSFATRKKVMKIKLNRIQALPNSTLFCVWVCVRSQCLVVCCLLWAIIIWSNLKQLLHHRVSKCPFMQLFLSPFLCYHIAMEPHRATYRLHIVFDLKQCTKLVGALQNR